MFIKPKGGKKVLKCKKNISSYSIKCTTTKKDEVRYFQKKKSIRGYNHALSATQLFV